MTEMKKLKVVVIGGGSSYTPELVKGLLAYPFIGFLRIYFDRF